MQLLLDVYAHFNTRDTTNVIQLSVLTSKVLCSFFFPKSMLIFLGEVRWVALLAEIVVNNTVTKSSIWMVVVGCCGGVWFVQSTGTAYSGSLCGSVFHPEFSISYYS